jgi:phospholipase C
MHPDHATTRRWFIGTAGATAAALSLPSIATATAPPRRNAAGLSKIEQIVIQENRSFDNYFGALRGVRSFNGRTRLTRPSGQSIFHQPDASRPEGWLLPFRLNPLAAPSEPQAAPKQEHGSRPVV